MKRAFLGIGLLFGFAMFLGSAAVHNSSLDGSTEPVMAGNFDGPPDPICPLPHGCPKVPKLPGQ